MSGAKTYDNLYDRLVANTREDEHGCWIWTGPKAPGGYPKVNVWHDGKHRTRRAHRVMLEEFHDIWFPFDEAGHLCNNPSCIKPAHLEVQTKAFNLYVRRVSPYRGDRCMIPTIFPRNPPAMLPHEEEALDRAVDVGFDSGGESALDDECPF